MNRNPKRRAAGVASAKIAIASASVAATLGGWAVIGATDTTSATNPAQSSAIAQAPAPQDTQPSTTTPFDPYAGRRGRERWSVPAPDDNNDENGSDDTAPTQPQQEPQQTQPQQQQPRFRTRSSR
ncbi:MAG TPA: hypothetical protein VFX76_16465 [Roseiflexaceae bacterium]|nr:hypothetical protein [Roseiflexaceae bacterium]